MSWIRTALLLLLIAFPWSSFANPLEPASPELQPEPSIWFHLQSTLPGLPEPDEQFGVPSLEPEAVVAYAAPGGTEVLRTAYQSEAEADLRAATARVLRTVVPVADELR